jgi:hypothetical protein
VSRAGGDENARGAEPVLTVGGPKEGRRQDLASTCALTVGLYAGIACGGLLAASHGGIAVVGTLAVVCLVGVVGGIILLRRATLDDLVAFEESRIVFRGPAPTALSWTEIRGYRDDSSDWIELVPCSWHPSRLLVPTRSEGDRVAVLALLDRKGLHRLE